MEIEAHAEIFQNFPLFYSKSRSLACKKKFLSGYFSDFFTLLKIKHTVYMSK